MRNTRRSRSLLPTCTSLWLDIITARIPNTDHLLINPFGFSYDEITASSLVKIDLDGNKIDNSPYPVNTAGYLIHSAVHSARHDLQCTVHTHSENAEAVACLKGGFIPMTQTDAMFYERVSHHDYHGIVLNANQKESLITDLGSVNHTLVLRNHGVLVGGPSIALAFSRLYYFELACRTQLKAMATGDKLNQLSHEVLTHTRVQFEGGDAQAGADRLLPEWPAHLRMLDRIDSGWRN